MELTEHSSGWGQAVRIAGRLQDHGISAAVRRYYVTILPLVVLAFLAAGLLLEMFVPTFSGLYLGTSFGLAGVAVIISGLVYAVKKVNPLVTPDGPAVGYLINKEEAKRGIRQACGRLPAEGEELIVARGLAIQMRKILALQLLVGPGFVLMFIPQAFIVPGTIRLIFIPLEALYIAVLGLAWWRFHQTSIFLKSAGDHGATGSTAHDDRHS